jgi:CHAP domain
MTRSDAVNWLNQQIGKGLNYDGSYGNQCVDYFNYYYQYLVGRSPYQDGYGVEGAKDLWNVATDKFTKIVNDPNDPNQLPKVGDIFIYNSSWGGGYGHVEMVLAVDTASIVVSAQNTKGQYVSQDVRTWDGIIGGLIGWMSYNGFNEGVSMSKTVRTIRACDLWNLDATSWAGFKSQGTIKVNEPLKVTSTFYHPLGGVYYTIEGKPNTVGVNVVDVEDYTAPPVVPPVTVPPVVVPPVVPPVVVPPVVVPPVDVPPVPVPPNEATGSALKFVARLATQAGTAKATMIALEAILVQQYNIKPSQAVLNYSALALTAVIVFLSQYGYKLQGKFKWLF